MAKTITVQAGDTLWALAEKHLGDPMKWGGLWHLNKQAIMAEQKRRNLCPDEPWDWIFPGTPLMLPTAGVADGA